MEQIAYYQDNGGEKIEAKLELARTYLTIYGSGWVAPDGDEHYLGASLEAVAKARHKINKRKHPDGDCVMDYCPTCIEFFDTINSYDNIVRLDIYCHGWGMGLNFGGFKGKRTIRGIELNSDDIDWAPLGDHESEGRNLRQLIINQIDIFDPSSFNESPNIYFWGCNIGGQLTLKYEHVLDTTFRVDGNLVSPKECFAQKFAERIGKGNVYALVGRVAEGSSGGSVFKSDGKNLYFLDGQMLPANVAANRKGGSTIDIDAEKHMKKFPLP